MAFNCIRNYFELLKISLPTITIKSPQQWARYLFIRCQSGRYLFIRCQWARYLFIRCQWLPT